MNDQRPPPPASPAWAAIGLAIALTAPSGARAQSVSLSGLTGPPVVVDAEAIRAMPHRTVTASILADTVDGGPRARPAA
jgi:hypothetical protein